jgi:hypothetical protein
MFQNNIVDHHVLSFLSKTMLAIGIEVSKDFNIFFSYIVFTVTNKALQL